MKQETRLECARCRVNKGQRACDSIDGPAPRGCPTKTETEGLAAAAARLEDPATRRMAQEASRQEASGYADRDRVPRPIKNRLQEIIEFARRMGFSKLGLAFCAGLKDEAEVVDRLLRGQGFEVFSVVCKVGGVAKDELGLAADERIRVGCFETMCHPVAQAELLNRAGTELNIMLGLCVGHDALFLKHAEAYTTVLAAKDRVFAHNPLAAVYTSDSYCRWLWQ